LRNKKKTKIHGAPKTVIGTRKFYSEEMKVVPSLKYKMLLREKAENQMVGDDREEGGTMKKFSVSRGDDERWK
jgi:hypothetical protein